MVPSYQERIEVFRRRVEKRGLTGALRHIVMARLLFLLKLLPHSERSDHLYAYLDFVRNNGRRPSDRLLYNDAFYRMKISGELASPLRVRTADKELAKPYIAERVGADIAVPTIAVLRTEQQIRTFDYPERCVIKPTHATGRRILRTDGEPIDLDAVVAWLDHDQFAATREPQYRGLERKVIVEPLLDFTGELGIFCYQGSATLINYWNPLRRLFTPDWNDLGGSWKGPLPPPPEPIPPPPRLDEILRAVEALARDFWLVRIDIYTGVDGDGFRVGEITHCPSNAGKAFGSLAREATISSILFAARPGVDTPQAPPHD